MLMNDLEIPREWRWGSVPFAGERLLDGAAGFGTWEERARGNTIRCIGIVDCLPWFNEGMASGLTVPAQWCIGWFNIRFRETKAVSA